MDKSQVTRLAELEDTLTVDGPFIVSRQGSSNPEAAFQAVLDAIEVIVTAGGRPVLLVILGERAAAPPPRMRAAMSELRKRNTHKFAAVALVVQGTGFSGAVHRSVISALQLVHRTDYPEKVFATVDAAAQWLAHYLPAKTTSGLLKAVCAEYEPGIPPRVGKAS